ncbi:ABC transporter ATP-binding protein [Chitinimonas sp.]|uniref:ABC transporter ATP-binding protein n=1 Tax=Chitinimonas sp. TaxID=1934313 RepID=UPI002F94AFB9
MNPLVIEIAGLEKHFGKQAVLKGLDWQIPAGKVVGLLGRNGAGKSTLMECMLGLREADAGASHLFGEPAHSLGDASRARIGYVPQQADLFEWLTPRQLLDYFRAFYPRWNTEKVEGLFSRWQIDRDKAISTLSGGQKQRLAIIRALAHDPELLILDEPVASLDPVGRRDFLHELIDGVIERNTTVLFSTHILSDLERIAMEVAFLKEGRITLQTSLDELLETTRRVSGPSEVLLQIAPAERISVPQTMQGGGSVLARLSPERLAQIRTVPALSVEPVSLEDLFVEVTQ